MFDGKKWSLYYNGRKSFLEQIGLATLDGHDLWSTVPSVHDAVEMDRYSYLDF